MYIVFYLHFTDYIMISAEQDTLSKGKQSVTERCNAAVGKIEIWEIFVYLLT